MVFRDRQETEHSGPIAISRNLTLNTVLCVARHHTPMTLAELGHRAGEIDYVSVASAIQRFHRRCQQDPPLARLLQQAHQQLQNAKM